MNYKRKALPHYRGNNNTSTNKILVCRTRLNRYFELFLCFDVFLIHRNTEYSFYLRTINYFVPTI